MKSILKVSLGLVVLVGVLSAGGCRTQEEYDQLMAMNRRVNGELEKANDRLRLLEQEKQTLEGQLAERDRTIKYNVDQIALLNAANKDLTDRLTALNAELAKLKGEAQKPIAITALPASLNKALEELAKKFGDLLTYDPKTGMVKFKSDMTFDKGSDAVKQEAVAALKELAKILNSPEAKPFNAYVAGHTDDIPLKKPDTIAKHGTNWGLAAHRAIAVIAELAKGGVDQPRMAGITFSKHHPIEANAAGEKGNAANRRVEIWIVPSDLLLSQPTGTAPKPKSGDSKPGGDDEEG